MKYCNKCSTEKPKTEFSKGSSKKDGLQSSCKSCVRAYNSANSERLAAQMREYRAKNAESLKDMARERYAENKEVIKAKARDHYAKNQDAALEQKRGYYAENAEVLKGKMRKYRQDYPEKESERSRNRRARARNAEGKHTAAEVMAIFESQRGKCASCHKKLFKSGKKIFHADHIVPLIKGGSNDKYNLQCLCPYCNLSKHDKDPIDWAQKLGKLL